MVDNRQYGESSPDLIPMSCRIVNTFELLLKRLISVAEFSGKESWLYGR